MQITDKARPLAVMLSKELGSNGALRNISVPDPSQIPHMVPRYSAGAMLTPIGSLAEMAKKGSMKDADNLKMIGALVDANDHLLEGLSTLQTKSGNMGLQLLVGEGKTVHTFDKYEKGKNDKLDTLIEELTATHAYLEVASNHAFRVAERIEDDQARRVAGFNLAGSISQLKEEIITSLDTILPGAGQNALEETPARVELIKSNSGKNLHSSKFLTQDRRELEIREALEGFATALKAGESPDVDSLAKQIATIQTSPRLPS